jgi:hypothetical protein
LKQMGTEDWDRERLNVSVNTPASWSAHALRMRLGRPYGPVDLQGLTHLNVVLTPAKAKDGLGSGLLLWHPQSG